jgi:beta-phosphoglucomutase
MSFEKQTAFLWDIDGVVADSPHEESWRKVAEMPEWGIHGLTSEFYLNHVSGKPRLEGADNIFERLDGYKKHNARTAEEKQLLITKYADQKNNIVRELIENGEFTIFDSSVIMLLEGKRNGMKMGAASASKNANAMLGKVRVFNSIKNGRYPFVSPETTVYDLFDVNVCGKTVPGGKPALFKIASEEIMKMTNGEVMRFIVFEDAIAGVEAAKKNGFFTVGIVRIGQKSCFEKAGADIVVHDLSEITYEELKKIVTDKEGIT